ncbi:MAG: NADH-quinone oxidoreductase subunit M [Thermoleophilaceae bacterium]|nr:NADH-quinone oxidoreductase subunit M [Thermoleophilaceae bacterium]
MTIHLSIVLFMPLTAGLLGAFLGQRAARWLVFASTLGVLGYAIAMLVDFESGSSGLQYVTDDSWIPELGIRYQLGVDGLNLFMVALTAVAWVPCTLVAVFREHHRSKLFFFNLALAETAVLGAFLAQDLALFIVFFDLMLVPFYFLIGGWGTGDRVRATTKFVIYTLSGSLLMLAGAIALGVLATPADGEISFSIATIAERGVGEGTQQWIFCLFALAFLVKAPLFPLHGWVPETYRSSPIVVLALLSGVLSKVGVYGFLRIVLPTMPDAAQHFQDLMLVLAVFSILYGSVLAFSQDNARMVVAYSSIAQLGFIVLGIFSLDPKGAHGAVFQMLNHGLITVPLFLLIGAVAARARGSESLAQLGGMARRAPVMAALFLIVALATLAMPGSPNFAGEILVLFGTFEDKFVYGAVASVGVILAAVYMIRVFQRTMHNREGSGVVSRELSGVEIAAIAPITAVIVALGVYPHFFTERSEAGTVAKVQAAQVAAGTGVTILPYNVLAEQHDRTAAPETGGAVLTRPTLVIRSSPGSAP